MTTPSLLDTLSVWLDTPEPAFTTWIGLQGYRPSSQRVYGAMFRRFCQGLAEQHVRLDQCESRHIRVFLDAENPNLPGSRQRPQTSRQRQQYVRLIERVYAHLGTLGLMGQNPGRQAGVDRVGAGSDQPARFLSVAECQAVIALAQSRLDALIAARSGTGAWVAFRDLALVGAILGGGLKPSHVSALTLNCIKLDEGVIDNSVPAHAHRARLLPFAQAALAAWLAVLEELRAESLALKGRAGGTPEQWRKSPLVFIADRSGPGFGRFSTSRRMHAASIFRRIQGFLEAAGVAGRRASPQTLRNTYAAMLIEGGATNAELISCLGLSAEVTAHRMRATVRRLT
ncbi:hypothetical protein [Propionivibrio sp.]|uniref:hypothetical protein n=1 Tax=Propionivibrio sp. TaxID=2212460 RepID=UPI003BEFFB9E